MLTLSSLWLGIVVSLAVVKCAVIEYDYNNFPTDVVALHMPCKESNMFATKCMCHIKCSNAECSNAKDICQKYQKSQGCKYMLLRKVGRERVATLKRAPKPEELARFDTSVYPQIPAAFKEVDWTTRSQSSPAPRIRDLVQDVQGQGNTLVERLLKSNSSSPLCAINSAATKQAMTDIPAVKESFLNDGIALAVLSYHTPKTLLNTLRTWNSSGLLGMVAERVAVLNDPLPAEHAMALHHGFQVLQPKNVPGGKVAKENVFTIGAAFYYTLQHIKSEYLLFLENDFKIDTELSRSAIQSELVAAAGMLNAGAEVVRLMSRKYQGCGTFKDCYHHGIDLASTSPFERKRNWYSFYCREIAGTEKYAADCFHEPDYRCFTSWDSNWTLNAVMVKKSTMLGKKYKTGPGQTKSIAEMGLSHFQHQAGFESAMIPIWQTWKVPVCISYQGLFVHEEIETSA